MGSLIAGILGIALILLVLGLGWHAVWNGLTVGAEKAKEAIVHGINYFLPSQPDDSSAITRHGSNLNKV